MSTSANEAPPEHVINFGCGHPDASLLPIDEIASATQKALTDQGRSWLQYGRENGNLPARQSLAGFLTTLYGEAVDPATLCFTSGVSHGIQVACRALQRMHPDSTQPLCFVEDPTYFLIPPIFQQSGYELDSVGTSPESGIDLLSLEQKLQAAREADPNRLLVLYSIPIHHNPLGVSLSEEARLKLVQLCETHRVYLIADEVYHGLSFPDSPSLQPMGVRKSPYVVSASAFTKILCPGIRCGWIQTNNQDLLGLIRQDGVLDSGGCSSQMSSGIVAQLIESGTLVQYMATLQAEYARRCQHLCDQLQNQKSCRFQFTVPRGGYFLWVQVNGIDFCVDEAFRTYCRQEHDVDFKTGLSCSQATWRKESPKQLLNSMRLCFAYYNTKSLSDGVERLCQAIESYPSKKASL